MNKNNHNVIVKVCSKCGGTFPLTDEYFYYKNKKKKEKGYLSWCKSCFKQGQLDYQKRIKEKRAERERIKRRENPEYNRSVVRRYRQRNLERVKINQRNWRLKNKDKLKDYNLQHRIHDITVKEWEMCKKYFDNSCAYCGISEDEAKERYGQRLHKDHVDHNGSNGIDNCVPACKGCNSRKHTRDILEWYSDGNPDMDHFEQWRLNKIIKWININLNK